MIKRKSYFIAIIVFILAQGLNTRQLSAQELSNTESQVSEFANFLYRSDDRLLNGKYYKPAHFFALGHPYFINDEWQNATLYIKGITYKNVLLKYNIEDDVIILKAIYDRRIAKDILLHNKFIDSLAIGTHLFHNTANFEMSENIGFAELIYKGGLTAYVKHSIQFKDELSERIKNGLYLDPKRKLYLSSDSLLYPISTKKDLIDFFPERKKDIKAFLRKNKIRYRKANTYQLVNLIRFCDQL
ncbi:MAG: hypothetical protein JW729_10200 [Bacteroidales bacterium]|nr:hypothetical protein [Bacteroidales bacterium]